jgi:nucleotide-binding universal stress UspA family protein
VEVDQGPKQPPWRILIAYDDSEPAKKAVELCASLPLDETTEVLAMGVLPMVTLYRQDIRQQLDPGWQQKKHVTRAALDAVVNAVNWSTPNVSTQLHEAADVSHEILDVADRAGSNLIMLGCKGKDAIERILLGSISHHVVRHAGCSVWVLRN